MRVRLISLVVFVLVLAATALGVVLSRPHDKPVPEAVAVARDLLPPAASVAAIEDSGAVGTGYHRTFPQYVGELTVWLACTGEGQVTLAVSAVPAAETGSVKPRDVARTTAICAAEPVRTDFFGDPFTASLVFDLAGTGPVEFAFRVTSDTGDPVSVQDYQQVDLHGAFHLDDGGDEGYSVGGAIGPGSEPDYYGPLQEHGDFTVAAACTGLGTLELRVGDHREQVQCSWKPQRHDSKLSWHTGKAPEIYAQYTSASKAPANWAVYFLS
jgi:hypothetical protein